ncbi:hypothetical protein [Psychromonas sp. L1A2]|uniref:hypothetical protein n=1 Tax=Psychromonas sp. L1A2 TaxID=2686356 RepID=UPI001F2A40C1|nr:hypothetical protein [Psychromonas sp. L1A2]
MNQQLVDQLMVLCDHMHFYKLSKKSNMLDNLLDKKFKLFNFLIDAITEAHQLIK